MPAISAGLSLATKRIQPGYPIKRRSEIGNWGLEYLYVVSKAAAVSQAAVHGASPPSPEVGEAEFMNLRCTGVDISPIGDDPQNVMLRETYELPSSRTFFDGDTFRSSTAAVVERPLEEHSTLTSAGIILRKAEGRRTFLAGSLLYRRREIVGSFTWSQANLVLGIGKRGAPTDLSAATANLWLKTERNVSEGDSTSEIDEAWQFDENGWDTDVYGT